jgi:hypothetical protein
MEPSATAVMVLLSCTPDALFCRELPQHTRSFETLAACELALDRERARLTTQDRRIIGACGAADARQPGWAMTPTADLLTEVERLPGLLREDPPPPEPKATDPVVTATVKPSRVPFASQPTPVAGATLPAEDLDTVLVRVTRYSGGVPRISLYRVERTAE